MYYATPRKDRAVADTAPWQGGEHNENKAVWGPSLLRRFTAVSLAATVAVGVAFGAIAARVVEDYAYRERAHTMAFYVSEFLAPRLTPQDFARSNASRVQFEFALRNLIGRAGIEDVTVWNPQGRILYSTRSGAAQRLLPLAPPVRLALNGRVAWRQARPAKGEPAGFQRLEVFIPVFVPGAARPVAVYDVVSKLSDLRQAIKQLRRSVWTSMVFGIIVLYSTLFSIVHRASRDLIRRQQALRQALFGTIRSLANAVDARDLATGNHCARVAEYAEGIARAMRLGEAEVRDAQAAGFLHDLGKIAIPDAILTKRGPLTEEEWATMRQHAVRGYEILGPVPLPERVKLAVRHSHEAWDGTGYPDGLSGDRIPLAARIVAVADTYETLTTARPYREAWSPQEAMEEICRERGAQFDPRVVDAFLLAWLQWTHHVSVLGRTPNPVPPELGRVSEAEAVTEAAALRR